jgi:hypothetical protein
VVADFSRFVTRMSEIKRPIGCAKSSCTPLRSRSRVKT